MVMNPDGDPQMDACPSCPTAPRELISPEADPKPPSLARTIAGWTCIVLGIVGLVLPFLQGVAFLLAGAALLGPRSYPGRKIHEGLDWGRRVSARLRERFGKKG
jgi:hypothetical protein